MEKKVKYPSQQNKSRPADLTIEFNLDKILEAKGLNMRQVAKLAGLSYVPVYKIAKNEQTHCALLTLQKLSDALEIPIGEFFRRKENPSPDL